MIPERSGTRSSDGIQGLIAVARGGNPDALECAIEACRRYLLAVAEHDLAPDLRVKEGASDLVQETLFEAHRDFGRFAGHTEGELRAWLTRLLSFQVAHAARRYRGTEMRKLGREVSISTTGFAGQYLADDQTSPSNQAIRHEEEAALRAALGRLPERMARVVLWRHGESCTFDELGRRLGCSNVAARKLWLRALRQLQQELKRITPGANGST